MLHVPRLSRHNSRRPPDARDLRAREIVAAHGRTTRFDDAETKLLLSFYRRLEPCCTPRDLDRLRIDFPHHCEAYEFRESAPATEIATLEVRLLAGEPSESIARKSALTAQAIDAYRSTFFDIEDRREAVDWIVHHVIGLPDGSQSDERLRLILVKTIGYFAGWQVLDHLLYPGSSTHACHNGEAAAAEHSRATLQLRAMTAISRLSTIDEGCRRDLVRVVREMQRDEASNDEQRNSLEKHIGAMLDEIPWTVGRRGEAAVPEEIAEYDRLAAELKDEELMLMAAGETPESIRDEVPNLDFQGLTRARTSTGKSGDEHPPGGGLR